MVLTLLLVACGPGEVTIQSTTVFCENVDLDDLPDPELETFVDGSVLTVERIPVLEDCDSEFDPDFDGGGGLVQIYEGWIPGESGTDCCFQPTVELALERGAKMQIEWYEEGANQPTHSAEVDAR
jgi:hypothetical protein